MLNQFQTDDSGIKAALIRSFMPAGLEPVRKELRREIRALVCEGLFEPCYNRAILILKALLCSLSVSLIKSSVLLPISYIRFRFIKCHSAATLL
ncbi:MAG: hypothetical protein D4S01_04480 [Dehalococcoidia bacterium]|nr:MAG: hypothetical protein D4S01_04480 [Dehalococcoidia bacterium]